MHGENVKLHGMHTYSVEAVMIGSDPSGLAIHMVRGYTSYINKNKDEY